MATIVLILLSCLFVAHVQCLGVTLHSSDTLKHHLNNIHRHQIARRQANSETPTSQDNAYCDSIEIDDYCSSGLGQSFVDVQLSCGESIESVRSSFNQCARSENGAFCGSLFHLNSPSQRYLEANCSGVITSNVCPPQCRAHLKDFKNKLGCCIITYISGSNYYFNRSSTTYRLWNSCGVPLPAVECQNHGLMFHVPANTKNCTSQEVYLIAFCEPNVGQSYINRLLKDTRCSQINLNDLKPLINTCSINPRGEFCILQILTYENNVSHSICDYEIRNITVNQDLHCRPTCRNKLVEMKNALGCCVNYGNWSTSDQNNSLPLLSYRLWASCGVEAPGFCESTLTLNGYASITNAETTGFTKSTSSLNGSVSTAYAMQWAFAWAMVAFAILLSIFVI